ncbi:MAG: ATP-binding cassette domain-containing protein [Actinomycetia bacterium]|nr:ATP-binding cassette domain-containing protein [Actinomycetes bacterium]
MLELKNVSFVVPSETGGLNKAILSDINLIVPDNSFLVITGHNGGGKSTLAKIIMGIEHPTSGQIIWNGQDITALDIPERANLGIGFAFQSPVRFKGLDVKELLRIATGQEMNRDEICGYLSEVGLCAVDYCDREINASLSGGELKRIEIAMLMARGSTLAIFDEPEAGIDLWSFHSLIRVFQKIREKNRASVIIISHQERILDIADQIIVISGGRIIQSGTRAEVLPDLLKDSETCEYYREAV